MAFSIVRPIATYEAQLLTRTSTVKCESYNAANWQRNTSNWVGCDKFDARECVKTQQIIGKSRA